MHLQREFTVDGKNMPKNRCCFRVITSLMLFADLQPMQKLTGRARIILFNTQREAARAILLHGLRIACHLYDVVKKIFDSVIVITDRNVLDQQLQNTIYQFEHKTGVVQRIDEDSMQLAETITSGTGVIITTLQKFPHALKHLGETPNCNYAVIIDEAHSSQGGEASRKNDRER